MISFGKTMPASKQARMPSAAYCVFELSPVAGPSFCFLIGIFRTTFGFTFSVPPKSRVPVTGFAFSGLSSDATPVGTSFGATVGEP
jgi:hypothetical protein